HNNLPSCFLTMIKGILVFIAGFYAGAYAQKNYDLPELMYDPVLLSEKVKEFLKNYEKPSSRGGGDK
ncbi:hypothetical protein BOX15_Mlig022034g2, partial [Macrostomum lignano]